MNWLTLGLASTGLNASISTADKVILERYLKSNWAYPFFTATFLGLYCLAILAGRLAQGAFHPPSLSMGLLALLPGLLHYGAALSFTQALLRADAATVAGISQASPIFGVVWGTLFLGDRFVAQNYAGVCLVVLCAVLLAWEKPQAASPKPATSTPLQSRRGRGQLNSALGLVLLGAMLRSLSELFTKVAVTNLTFWDAFSLSRLGALLPALLLLAIPVIRAGVLQPVKQSGAWVVVLVGSLEIFALLNLMLITAAFARGPLALVSATQSTVPLFILTLTGLANRIWPGAVPVKDNGLNGLIKLMLCGGMVFGVYLISIRG